MNFSLQAQILSQKIDNECKLHQQAQLLLTVSDEAMNTHEVSSAFLTAILENREDIVSALLRRGFDVNATADSAGLTGLHLASAFNYLPLVKIILASGACIFALAHSSGKKAADSTTP